MLMDWESLARLVPVVAPVAVAVLGATRGPNPLRTAIRHDAETLKELPAESPAAKALESFLMDQIERLARASSEDVKRNVPMLVLALFATPLLGWGTIALYQRGGMWVLAAVLVGTLATVFLYGIFESAQKVPRDGKGKRKTT
jgi:hypothetical protein